MMGQMSLEDALNPEVKPEEEKAPAEPEKAEQEQPESEEKAESTEEVPEPAEEPKMVPQQALHEERSKRQDVEKRYSDLADQVGQLLPHLGRLGQPEKEGEPKEPLPSFTEDPEGFVTRALEQIQSGYQTELTTAFMTLSENQARARHEDYDEMLGEFAKLTKQHPMLKQQVRQQIDPAEWAYQLARQHKERSEIGDPAEFRKKALEEARAQIKAEMESEPQPDASSVPKSLANARNVGGGKRTAAKTFEGPTPLDVALSKVPGRAKQ